MLGKVKIQRGHWDLVTYINITSLEIDLHNLRSMLKRVGLNCETLKTFCEYDYDTLHKIENECNKNFQDLLDLMGNRNKRSWYDSLKYTVKIIHGIINPEEVDKYSSLIDNEFKNKINNEFLTMNNKITITGSNILKQSIKLEELKVEVQNTAKYLNQTLSYNKIQFIRTNMTSELNKLINLGLSLNQDMNTIINAILFAKRNSIHPTRIAQVVHIRYFILKMSKISHRVRFIVGIFFPWSLILLRLFYADFVRFILSTLYGVFYRHCTVYFTDTIRFILQTLYGSIYRHCTVYLTYIVRCI